MAPTAWFDRVDKKPTKRTIYEFVADDEACGCIDGGEQAVQPDAGVPEGVLTGTKRDLMGM